jgi:hypothetical protein
MHPELSGKSWTEIDAACSARQHFPVQGLAMSFKLQRKRHFPYVFVGLAVAVLAVVVRGMAYYAEHARIFELWKKEAGQESYYGFRLEEVERLLRNPGNSQSLTRAA